MSVERIQRYWEELLELDAFAPAPVEDSLGNCYAILARLHGTELGALEVADPGECDDRCGQSGPRVRIGRVRLCRRCAFRRKAAMRRAA